jgi:hypothetical protein
MNRLLRRVAWGMILGGVVSMFPGGGACASPAPESPSPAYRCTLEARFDRLDDAHYIKVQGATNLPERAVLQVGAYYVKPPSAIFIRPDRPPPPPDLYLLDETDRIPESGKFEARLWIVNRLPYPGTYRIRALLRWSDQPEFLRGENPREREPLEWSVEIVHGTQEDLDEERATIRNEVKADIDRVAAFQREMKTRFREAMRNREAAAAWEPFLKTVRARMAPLKARNEKRLEYGVIWTETQGKYRVQDLSERLEGLAVACSKALEARETKVSAEIAEQEEAFQAIFEGALNLLGFLKPVDPALVKEHFGPILKDFDRLEKAAVRLGAEPPGMTPASVETLRGEVFGRLRTCFGTLLPAGPDQAVEPATRYTEAVLGFFTEAVAVAGGTSSGKDGLRKRLEAARAHLKRLTEMLLGS